MDWEPMRGRDERALALSSLLFSSLLFSDSAVRHRIHVGPWESLDFAYRTVTDGIKPQKPL